MENKFLRAYICITVISIFGASLIGVLYGHDFRMENQVEPVKEFFRTEHSPQSEPIGPAKKLIGGICALLLLGYLFIICYQKFKMDSKAESVDLANALHKISLESGQTEYELFVIASREWSIAESQIDKDFKNYMAASVLPFYVMDLVRKNNDRIDGSLKKIEEMEPTSRWDLVKALLIFPGCFFLLIFLLIVFHPDFVKY